MEMGDGNIHAFVVVPCQIRLTYSQEKVKIIKGEGSALKIDRRG